AAAGWGRGRAARAAALPAVNVPLPLPSCTVMVNVLPLDVVESRSTLPSRLKSPMPTVPPARFAGARKAVPLATNRELVKLLAASTSGAPAPVKSATNIDDPLE